MSIRIGVFDSGVGGITVLKELVEVMPAEYFYIGDTLRAPYGNKSKEELLAYTKELLSFLQKKNSDLFISACNSLSTLDVAPLLEELGIKKEQYFDMTMFAEVVAATLAHDATLLVYATEATVRSGVYQNVFKNFSPEVLASTNLARAIEDKHEIEIDEEVDKLLDYVLERGISHVFLGCTHYPLIEEYLEKRFFGIGVTFINPATSIKEVLKEVKGGELAVSLFYTKSTPYANELSKEFFGKDGNTTSL
jgi:glutamate racemase